MRYEIKAGKSAPFRLLSVLETDAGDKTIHFISEGTWAHCERLKSNLEKNA